MVNIKIELIMFDRTFLKPFNCNAKNELINGEYAIKPTPNQNPNQSREPIEQRLTFTTNLVERDLLTNYLILKF